MAFADALLEQANELLAKDPRRPKQASLRRAISATYYALFHRLIADATQEFVGPSPSGQQIRDTIARWFGHRCMADVAGWFSRPFALKKGSLRSLLVDETKPPTSRVPADLAAVAEAFEALQEARHTADYDLSAWYSRAEARALVGRGAHAFEAIGRLNGDPTYGLFLLLLLTGEKAIVSTRG